MAFANFHQRSTTAASQVLADFRPQAFDDLLSAHVAAIAFDAAAVASGEGRVTLDMLVRLLARLHPRIAIAGTGVAAKAHGRLLEDLARAINPEIEIGRTLAGAAVSISVGTTRPKTKAPVVYVGSDGWTAKVSSNDPVGSADSRNPFGAGGAACLAAANAFRIVFAGQIPRGAPDRETSLCLLDCSTGASPDAPFELDALDLGVCHLVGLGAIGNGALWALARAEGLRGTVHLVDHERVDLSNLQRYVLATQEDLGAVKADVAARSLSGTRLVVESHALRWSDYAATCHDEGLGMVAVAVDTAADRMAVQAALPRRVINAWTQASDLGVSRHGFGDGFPCLACLYMPNGKVKDEHEKLADELMMPEIALEIRTMLQTAAPVTAHFAARVAAALSLPPGSLDQLVGASVRDFHQATICGGLAFRLSDGRHRDTATVPMPFQSALAGIMLAGEIVKEATTFERSRRFADRIDLLRPLSRTLQDPMPTDRSGRCLCADLHFIARYREKHPLHAYPVG